MSPGNQRLRTTPQLVAAPQFAAHSANSSRNTGTAANAARM